LIFFFSEGLIFLVEELSRIVEVIKEEYDPERIIVFGSMAGNNIHEWSEGFGFQVYTFDSLSNENCRRLKLEDKKL
jgi:hypothetical protein